MFIVSISFIGAFPDGDKVVKIFSPSGGGGNNYHLMVDQYYWGTIADQLHGWRVNLQKPNPEYSAGDLQPLIDYIVSP